LLDIRVGGAYELLIDGINQVAKDIRFVRDERLGFVTFSPRNLGTAIGASARVEFDNMSQQHRDKFDETACKFNLKINKIDGSASDKLCAISSVKCMGASEFETVRELADGIAALIDVDKSL
jgi:arginine kinase